MKLVAIQLGTHQLVYNLWKASIVNLKAGVTHYINKSFPIPLDFKKRYTVPINKKIFLFYDIWVTIVHNFI